jgi:formylmethanofuran dehydrogenase subunit E
VIGKRIRFETQGHNGKRVIFGTVLKEDDNHPSFEKVGTLYHVKTAKGQLVRLVRREFEVVCSKCEEGVLHPETEMIAISRRDNRSICDMCAAEEAFEDIELY